MTTLIAANINLDTTGNNKVFANLSSNSFVIKTSNTNYSLNSTSVSANNRSINATGFYENSVLLNKGIVNTFVIPVVSSASPVSDTLSSNQLYKISDYSNTFYQTLFSSLPYADATSWSNGSFSTSANTGGFTQIVSGPNTNIILAASVPTRFLFPPGSYFYDLQRSTDGGITWTSLNELQFPEVSSISLDYHNGFFYLRNHTIYLYEGPVSGPSFGVYVSANGQSWTRIWSSDWSNSPRGLFFSGNTYYVIKTRSDNLDNRVEYSTTDFTSPITGVFLYPHPTPNNSMICGAAAPNGTFVVAGIQGRMYRRLGNSTSASIIFNGTELVNNSTFNSFAFGNGVFVGVTDQGETVSSRDAFNWVTTKVSNVTSFSKILYNDGLFYALGSNGTSNRMLYTNDGYNWFTIANSSPGGKSLTDFAIGNGVFLTLFPNTVGSNTYPAAANLYSYNYNTNFKVPPYANVSYQNYYMLDGSLVPTNSGQAIYTKPGGYYWTAPFGVNNISVVCIGGGGGGGGSSTNTAPAYGSYGGGGGALAYASNVSVIPGKKYLIVVGQGGNGGLGATYNTQNNAIIYSGTVGFAGSKSLAIFENSFTITAEAGSGGGFYNGSAYVSAQGGTYSFSNTPVGVITGGGNGGNSGFAQYSGSGGGGGGGYNGSGGEGAHIAFSNAVITPNSYGAGAGGGASGSSGSGGLGNNGSGNGGIGTVGSTGAYGGGGGGSSIFSNTNILERNGKTAIGGAPGGGGGGFPSRYLTGYTFPTGGSIYFDGSGICGGNGASGGVKIVWGSGRSFPNTASDV